MDKRYIDQHEAYLLIKHEAETHELPESKNAYERAARIVDQMRPENIAIMEWIPFTRRPLTEEEEKMYPELCYMLDGPVPDDDEKVLVSDGLSEWIDVFDVDEASLAWHGEIENGMAWMSLPKPYEGE